MLKNKKGKQFDFSKAREIAAGGEGRILEHPTDLKKVVKIYHAPRPQEFAYHLEILSGFGDQFVKPQEIYYDGRGRVAGFDMAYVNFNEYFLFNNLFNKGFCIQHGIDKKFKIAVLSDMRRAVEEIHAKDVVVGDLNQYNLFFSKAGKCLFVDVDSYASHANHHTGVLLDDIRDWTTLDINKSTDSWAYDVLSFWATTFCHPFKWVVPGNTETLEQRVKAGKSFLKKIAGMKIPALYEPPVGKLADQFTEIFSGRRYMVNIDGAGYAAAPAVVVKAVSSKSLEIREIMTGVVKINACRTKVAVRTDKWQLLETAVHKITRVLETVDCDELYPSDERYAILKKNILLEQKQNSWHSFSKPVYYYSAGQLAVFDYGQDIQYNFDIANQFYGIAYSTSVIYTKSVLVRDTPIQNFGGKKFLNLPNKTSSMLIEVPMGTKNAYYSGSMVAFEHKERSRVHFIVQDTSGMGARYPFIELDYLPHFTTKEDIVFIPESGFIDVYIKFGHVSKIDCAVCTRDSKLYNTDAGILLLENGTLYLLNTKPQS